jgi:hypothetical protein
MQRTENDLLFGGPLAGPLHIVECYWPGVSLERVAAADLETGRAVEELPGGLALQHLGSLLLGADELLLRLFHGGSAELVRAVNVRAGVPVERVVETVGLAPHPGPAPLRST